MLGFGSSVVSGLFLGVFACTVLFCVNCGVWIWFWFCY